MKTLLFAALALQVVSFSKNVEETARSDDFLSRTCAQWTLTQEDVQYFFAHAEAMSSEEWHHAYAVMPCEYRGSATVDGKQYRFEINGGSFGVLLGTSPSGASYYGCKKRCAKLFPFQIYDDE
jgi:hypothetical protein